MKISTKMTDICIGKCLKAVNDVTLSFTKKKEYISADPNLVRIFYRNTLTDTEWEEIEHFAEIYFIGTLDRERSYNGMTKRDYIPHDHIGFRYEIIKVMGKGSFGTVIKAFDHKDFQFVALKMVKHFHDCQIVQNEIEILKYLQKKFSNKPVNIIQMLHLFNYKGCICFVFELMWIDLYELLRRNKFKGCGLRLVQKFCFSLLICLNALYDCNIIHGDIKPENIMLKKPGYNKIKVIDFSCSCFLHERKFTYIQSRFYRAPEVILGAPYDMAVDMWSLGCVLAEMHTGYPLLPGENAFDQIALIMELKGIPPKQLLKTSIDAKDYITAEGYPKYCNIITSSNGTTIIKGGKSPEGRYRQPPGTRQLSSALDDGTNPEPEFIDFINRCLEYDPSHRMKPAEALQHAWLKKKPST